MITASVRTNVRWPVLFCRGMEEDCVVVALLPDRAEVDVLISVIMDVISFRSDRPRLL